MQSTDAAGAGSGGFSLPPEIVSDPYRFYAMLRSGGPIVHLPGIFGLGAWMVTSHALVSTMLKSKQFGKEGQGLLSPEQLAALPFESGEIAERRRSNMLFRDPPEHTRLRGLVSLAFTPKTVERLRGHVAAIAERLLDSVEKDGAMDLVSQFAFILPITVIAELLGVPAEDRDRFKVWSTELTMGLDPRATPEVYAKVKIAIEALDDYLRGVVEERRKKPANDLITDMLRVQEADDRLSEAELLATCRLLLNAGHETTVNLIGNGVLALLRHPEARARVASDPAILPGTIEELLRYDSPVQMTVRYVLEDTELGPHRLRRGDLAVALLGAANRDPAQFADPDVLDPTRANAQTHLSFGSGIHYCLGAALARLEGAIAVGALLRRLPRLALVDGPLTWRSNMVLRGLAAMPVTF